jgi:hypothetical protein
MATSRYIGQVNYGSAPERVSGGAVTYGDFLIF